MHTLPHLPLDVKTPFEQALKPHHEVCQRMPSIVHAFVDQLDQAVPAVILRSQLSSPLWVRALLQHILMSMESRTASAESGDAATGSCPCSCLQQQCKAPMSVGQSLSEHQELGTPVCSPFPNRGRSTGEQEILWRAAWPQQDNLTPGAGAYRAQGQVT